MNKRNFRPICLMLMVITITTGCDRLSLTNGSHKYYVSSTGDDNNPGTIGKPWLSIDKVNSIDLDPGDTVFFEANQAFKGTIRLDSLDSGNEDMRVVIGSYGDGKAIIDGGKTSAVVAEQTQFLTIRELKFRGDGRKEGNTEDGVLIKMCNSVHIDQIEVYGFQHSGLHLTKCDEARITHVYAHDNGFAGIHVTGSTMNDPVRYDNNNLYIGYCVAENNPGDPTVLKNHSGNGILASSVKKGVIEYCEAFNNGWDMIWTGNGPVGIWIWDCTDFIIQHCISHDNKTNPKAADGGGYDFDGGISDSKMQYNLSYNNQGCGYGLYEFGAAKPWENNTIRYNISQNDGSINGGSVGIWKADNQGTMRNCEIYNNTFYNSLEKGPSIWLYSNYPGFCFRNNIFVYNGSLLDENQRLKDEVFQANVYWNLAGNLNIQGYQSIEAWSKATGKEIVMGKVKGLFTDPMLTNPGTVTVTDPTKMTTENLSGYVLQPTSPLIDWGLDLKSMFGIETGGVDFFGTVIPQDRSYEPGAAEFVNKL
jgi:Right handed beta helix region